MGRLSTTECTYLPYLHFYRYTFSRKRCFGAWGGSVKVSQQVKNSQLGELSFFTVQIH